MSGEEADANGGAGVASNYNSIYAGPQKAVGVMLMVQQLQ